METITSQEMSIIDTNCEYFGLSRLQLMENAGRGLADEIMSRVRPCRVAIFAGLGNNGGDAFVTARFLKGYDVEIYLMGSTMDIKTDIAMRNFLILKNAGFRIIEVKDSTMLKDIDAEVIVDGMLGTGVKGRLRQPYAKAVEMINESDATVFAVDVPTGLNPDTGEYDECVEADVTVTFHKAKPGLLKAKEVVGELVVKDIGIPEEFERLIGPGEVRITYRRFEFGHKGNHGRILIVGGGEYTGAPALTALASLHAGADIATLIVPEKIYPIVAGFSPNLIVRKVKGDAIGLEHLNEIVEIAKRHHVVVLGMGVGRNEGFKEFVEEFLKHVGKAVLDADGLTADIPEDVECVLTPHAGEFNRVFGLDASVENAKKVAERISAVILLKGKEDVVTDGERVRINKSGNAGMTVGGTGDVLAGVVGAFFALNDAFWSACAAAFINGRAGELCYEELGYNYTAMDLIGRIPKAITDALSNPAPS